MEFTYKIAENKSRTIEEIAAEINKADAWSADTAANYAADLDTATIQYNESKKTERIIALFALDLVKLWTEYCKNPTYTGKRVTIDKDGKYRVDTTTLDLRFKALEKAYQLAHSTETDEKGNPAPNKSVTLCADPHYMGLISLFIKNIDSATCADLKAKQPELSATVKKTLEKLGLECFKKNTSDSRQEQLRAIAAAMLPKEITCKMILADVKYITICETKARRGNVQGKSEKQVIDDIIVAMGYRMQNKAYTFQSKANCYKKAEKAN